MKFGQETSIDVFYSEHVNQGINSWQSASNIFALKSQERYVSVSW